MPKKLPRQSAFNAPNRRARNFLIELYPDSKEYNCEKLLGDIAEWFDETSYILHDMDTWLDNTEINGVQHQAGELKKPHYHVLVKSKNPKNGATVCDKLGLPYCSVQYCNNYNAAMRYLIHLDNPEKYQYNIDNVITNCPHIATICNIQPDKGAIFMDVFNFLRSNSDIDSWEELIPWADENSFLEVCFARFSVINAILLGRERKHNRKRAVYEETVDKHI